MKTITRLPRLPKRPADSHKGSFGHVLIVGGALGMSGAVALAGRAAGRGGAGLVTLACADRNQPVVAGLVPEALTIPLPQRADGRIDPRPAGELLAARHAGWTVLAAGPGWGTADDAFAADSVAMIRSLAGQIAGPAVVDADALNLLAATHSLEREPWPGPSLVITPHPGEMARLLGQTTAEVQADRRAAAAEAVARLGRPIVVLKGAGTVVADAHRCYVNRTGNPGMATGGTGDVLTGLLAALAGQGLEPFDAAVLAVHLHGLAGDLAARTIGQVSLQAGDLVACLPDAFEKVQRRTPRR